MQLKRKLDEMSQSNEVNYQETPIQETINQIMEQLRKVKKTENKYTDADMHGRNAFFFVRSVDLARYLRRHILVGKDYRGQNPLFAVRTVEMAEFFLGYLMDRDEHGRSALFYAQSVEMIEWFVKHGLCWHLDNYGRSPLFFAQHPEVALYWMKNHNYLETDNYGRSPLFFAQSIEMAQFWEQHGLKYEPNYQGEYPVYHAECEELIRYMVDKCPGYDADLWTTNCMNVDLIQFVRSRYMSREKRGQRTNLYGAGDFHALPYGHTAQDISQSELYFRGYYLKICYTRTPAVAQIHLEKRRARNRIILPMSAYLYGAYSMEMVKFFEEQGGTIEHCRGHGDLSNCSYAPKGDHPAFFAETVEIAKYYVEEHGFDPMMIDRDDRTVLFTCANPKVMDYYLSFGVDINYKGRNYNALCESKNPMALIRRGANLEICGSSSNERLIREMRRKIQWYQDWWVLHRSQIRGDGMMGQVLRLFCQLPDELAKQVILMAV